MSSKHDKCCQVTSDICWSLTRFCWYSWLRRQMWNFLRPCKLLQMYKIYWMVYWKLTWMIACRQDKFLSILGSWMVCPRELKRWTTAFPVKLRNSRYSSIFIWKRSPCNLLPLCVSCQIRLSSRKVVPDLLSSKNVNAHIIPNSIMSFPIDILQFATIFDLDAACSSVYAVFV